MTDAATLAAQAWLLVVGEPARARSIAERAVLLAVEERDPASASVAHRALGMVALELDDADASIAHQRRAIAAAGEAADPALAAEAEMCLALALQHRGQGAAALRHAGVAHDLAPGSARLGLQRALLLERLGRTAQALDAYDEVERVATAAGDHQTLVRVHCNRGVLLIYRGDFPDAERDLLRAEQLCGELDLTAMAAGVRSNLGFLAARRGNLVEALQRFEFDRETMEGFGGLRFGTFELDRCEVLLLAGLPRDAAAAGRAAIATLDAAGMHAEAAEARVMTARAALRSQDPVQAAALADAALRAFARQGRAPWVALAREVMVRAQWATGRRDNALSERARRAADALDEAGWPDAAASARLLSAQLALEIGKTGRAKTELRRASAPRTGPVGVRVQARHAAALLRVLEGDRRGAQAALRAGWQALDDHRATLGATELRVGAGSHAVDLAALGVRLAVERGRPEEVLEWAERGRAGALSQPPARAPDASPLADALAALRATVADLDDTAKAGDDTRPLLRRQAMLEAEVRRQAQVAEDAGVGGSAVALSAPVRSAEPAMLADALGEHAMVELLTLDGTIHAVVVAAGELTLHALGPADAAVRESEALRMALGRLGRAGAPAPLRAAALGAARHAAATLAAQLIAPLRPRIDGRPLVLVPTGALHGTPWPLLPGVGADHTVAPSAALWARTRAPAAASTAVGPVGPVGPVVPVATGVGPMGLAGSVGSGPGGSRGILLAAGPGLTHADAEVEAIGALYPGATVLPAARATAEEVRRVLPQVELAHLACHGRFRDDNPLFSALEFAGGHLSVFELERLRRVPDRLVLSACDAGLSAVRPGDELMGLASALLRLGTRTLVASVLPVPDAASRRLMVDLHRELVAGTPASTALARARAAGDPEDPDDLVASAAFLSFGSGV